MSEEQNPRNANLDEVPHDAWERWCEETTAGQRGRGVELHQADRALGKVQLAETQALVAIEYERFGNTETLTIKCGASAVPVSYVVTGPRTISQRRGQDGAIDAVDVVDATDRRTSIIFA